MKTKTMRMMVLLAVLAVCVTVVQARPSRESYAGPSMYFCLSAMGCPWLRYMGQRPI